MKAVILAGGRGTRLAEETSLRPKPMVEIGGMPILMHIMHSYATFGVKDFIICLGYKGEIVRDYFLNFARNNSDFEINLSSGVLKYYTNSTLDWNVSLIDTGQDTETAGRLRRVSHLVSDQDFFCTYGDGLSNVNLKKLMEVHSRGNGLVTLTAVSPEARYGAVEIKNAQVSRFKEKPVDGEGLINGGFFMMNPSIFDYIETDSQSFEKDILPYLVEAGKVNAFEHTGFWRSMDTLRDANYLRELWDSGKAPWFNVEV